MRATSRTVSCAWCGNRVFSLPWSLSDRMFDRPGVFHLGRCESCRSLQLLDPPDDLGPYYPEEAYYSYASTPCSVAPEPAARVHRRPAALYRLAPRYRPVEEELAVGTRLRCVPRVLDVGCGAGGGLDRFARLGWETHGIEIGRGAARRARERGHRVETGSFPEIDASPRSFELVLMRHVLEHLHDPTAALRKAFELLAAGGRLMIEVPNVGGWLARLGGSDYWQLDPPRHLVLPSRGILGRCLVRAGFQVELSETYSWGKGVAHTWCLRRTGWRLGDDHKPRRHATIRRLAEPFALLADLARRGDNLRFVARRPVEGEEGPAR